MPRSRPHAQRGFVLIVVLLILLVMAAVSATVLLSTQADLHVSASDREARVAFYAAEAGVANAKEWLLGRAGSAGPGAWTATLRSGAQELCERGDGTRPGATPRAGTPTVDYDAPRSATYRYCVRNNALDPGWFARPATGDDSDGDGVIAIESFGTGPNGARSHLTVEVSAGRASATSVTDYFQAGGDGRKQALGEAIEAAPRQVAF